MSPRWAARGRAVSARAGIVSLAVSVVYPVPAVAREIHAAAVSGAWILGEVEGERVGNVFGPGDLDGDGVDELLVGGPYYGDRSINQGRACLFYGGPGRFRRGTRLSEADACFVGEGSYDYVGWSGSRPFDFDSDGHPDLLLGAYQYGVEFVDQGRIYVFRGGPGVRLSGQVALTEADYILEGSARGQRLGFEIAPAGDMDRDGMTDLVIGAPYMGQNPIESQAWLLLSGRWDLSWIPGGTPRDPWPPPPGTVIDTADLGLMVLNGDLEDSETGWSVWGGEDVTGDGIDDLLVGAPRFAGDDLNVVITGKSYLVAGRELVGTGDADGWDGVQALEGRQAVLELSFVDSNFLGTNLNDRFGFRSLLVPDVGGATGPGGLPLAEVLVGAPGAEIEEEGGDDAYSGGGDVGVVYCFTGREGGWPRTELAEDADGTISGAVEGEMLGMAMDLVADLDGDGFPELVLGAPGGYFGGAIDGVVYQVGAERACSGPASSLDADVAWVGLEEADLFGRYLAAVGDVDGDGHPDFAVGAPGSGLGGWETGAVVLVGPGLLLDDDGDGLSEADGDCHDGDAQVGSGEGEDADCDGVTAPAGDCDDQDPYVAPGRAETCDGVDQDCDGEVDEGTDCFDGDGDGYTVTTGDCDDAVAEVNLGAAESCDGLDNDCDGLVDEHCGCGCGASPAPATGGAVLAFAAWVIGRAVRSRRLGRIGAPFLAAAAGAVLAPGAASAAEFRTPAEVPLSAARARFTSVEPFMRLYQGAGAGDLDGDGLGDLLLLDWRASYEDVGDGFVGILPGGTEPWGFGSPTTSAPHGRWGSALLDNLGQRLVSHPRLPGDAGPSPADIDGDGYDDLVLATPGNNDEGSDNKGRAWIFWGGPDLGGWEPVAGLDTRYEGSERGDRMGRGAGLLGDVDGDGFADFAVASPFTAEGFPELDSGIVYFFLGGPRDAARFEGGKAADRATAVLKQSFPLGHFGHDIAWVGDLTGDGRNEVLIGQEGWSTGENGPVDSGTPGRTWLYPSEAFRSLDPDDDDQEIVRPDDACATWVGSREKDLTSQVIGSAGDVDGDGLDDLFFGAPFAARDTEAGADSPAVGRAWIVFGATARARCEAQSDLPDNTEPEKDPLEDGEVDATFGGTSAGDEFGWAFARLGDVDGDGLSDLLVTAPGDDRGGPGTGLVLLFLGRPAADWGGGRLLTADDADAWIVVPGPDNAYGIGLAALGDLDGDGRVEFTVGGPLDDTYGEQRGSVWVLSADGFFDDDGDGATEFEGDCDDTDPAVFPGAEGPGVDADCDGVPGDAGDCDDQDATAAPGVPEVADGVDNDCDGRVDEGSASADEDGDGTPAGSDCDDYDPTVALGLAETCDGRDQDCDGDVDEGACDEGCSAAGGPSSAGAAAGLGMAVLWAWRAWRRGSQGRTSTRRRVSATPGTILLAAPTLLGMGSAGCAGLCWTWGEAGPGACDEPRGEQAGGNSPVDVLWIIDNSNSMAPDQANVQENFGEFIGELAGPDGAGGDATVDFQMGFTTTQLGACGTGNDQQTDAECLLHGVSGKLRPLSEGESDPYFLFPGDEQLESHFVQMVDMGIRGDTTEYGLAVAARAACLAVCPPGWTEDVERDDAGQVTRRECVADDGSGAPATWSDLDPDHPWYWFCRGDDDESARIPDEDVGWNLGFLREDATLVVVIVTDEGDSTPNLDADVSDSGFALFAVARARHGRRRPESAPRHSRRRPGPAAAGEKCETRV